MIRVIDYGFEPFLKRPFAKGTKVEITEVFGGYSAQEHAIHGFTEHRAIDFAAERMTAVYSPCNGLAVCSFHTHLLDREYQGKQVGCGLGYFINIYCTNGLRVCLGHLEFVHERVPYLTPVEVNEGNWDPQWIYQPNDWIPPEAVAVSTGDLIGGIGASGLSWGYLERPEDYRGATKPHDFRSWDEFHTDFRVARRGPDGLLAERYDPYALESAVLEDYTGLTELPPGSLWIPNELGLPAYAR